MRWQLSLLALCWIGVSPRAGAAVQQTDGTAVPRLPVSAERNLVTQTYGYSALTNSWWGLDGEQLVTPIVFGQYYSPPDFPQFVDDDAITLGGLFKWRGEALDWQADATAPSGAFTPHCSIRVEPVLRGGNCDATLAWYNVADAASPTPPKKADLYELLPANLAEFLDCRDGSAARKTDGFCPLAWDTRQPRNLSQQAWVPNSVTLDLANDSRYLGGAIGFALVPAAATPYCKDTHYSVLEHNLRDAADEAFVTSLVYTSRTDPGAFYLAFEDGIMLPGDWTNGGKTDGDYNDYVAYVSGCFDGSGGGPGGGGGAGAEGAGAPSAEAGVANGGTSPTSGGTSPTSGGTSPTSGHTGQNQGEGGDAGPDRGSGGDAGGRLDRAGAGSGDERKGSSSADGGCACHLSGQSRSSALLLACALGAGWWARRGARRRQPIR